MLGIPHRATDNKFISNIEGYKGNIHKLGRLLTHVCMLALKMVYKIKNAKKFEIIKKICRFKLIPFIFCLTFAIIRRYK